MIGLLARWPAYELRKRLAAVPLAAVTLAVSLIGSAPPAAGHEASMAVMVLREFGPGRYVGQWTMAPADERLRPIFPEHCEWTPPELNCGARGLVGRLRRKLEPSG